MSFGTLALIVAIGLLGPILAMAASRAAPPVVIGEVTAGVIFGRTGTGTIHPENVTLTFLAAIGFALLMFIVGTNLPMRDRRMIAAARRALLPTAVTLAGAAVVAPLVAWLGGVHKLAMVAVLVAASSAAVALPIVQAEREEDPSGDSEMLCTLAWISIVDVITVLALPLVLSTGSVWRALAGSIVVIATAGAVGLVAARSANLDPVVRLRDASHTRNWALDLRISLLVLFTLAWIAEKFDTTVLIAGFAAGATVAALGEPRRVAQQLLGLGEGFFVPLFFVVLGSQLDLRALVHSGSDIKLLVLLTVAAVAVHVLAAIVTRLPVAHGLLASAQLGVPSAVAAIGLSSGTLRPSQAAAIIGAAALSLAVAAAGAAIMAPAPPS